jgi:hypothetical protein
MKYVKEIVMKKYGIELFFRDGIKHTITTQNADEARKYLEQIYDGFSINGGRCFRMLNNAGEIVYMCNLNNVIHAMIVEN